MESMASTQSRRHERMLKLGLIVLTGILVALSIICHYRQVKQITVTYMMKVAARFRPEHEEVAPEDIPLHMKVHYGNECSHEYEKIEVDKDQLYKGELVLVNKKAPCRFLEGQLVCLNDMRDIPCKIEADQYVHKEMAKYLGKMLSDFKDETHIDDIIVTSGYRSFREQGRILTEKVDSMGKQEALKWAMLPGYSEHHTGYAVDLGIYTKDGIYISYKGQDEYSWINKNCFRYGIIRRYMKEKQDLTGVNDEPWHYRYVGTPHAAIIMGEDLCLEEYVDKLKKYKFDRAHLEVEIGRYAYEIYFVPKEEAEEGIPILINTDWTISGNNIDGYIVTCRQKENK